MCLEWETFTGLKLEPGEEVNLKLHVELKSKIRQTNKPVPPHSEPEPQPTEGNYGMGHRPQPRPPQRRPTDALSERYTQAVMRLDRREAEELQHSMTRELERSMQRIMHYRTRDQPRYHDERYHAVRHRDPGAHWDVTR
jgi:hypothetical protein